MPRYNVVKVPVERFYAKYKEDQRKYFDKYCRHDGNPLLFKNTPIAMFIEKYLKIGKDIMKCLDDQPYIQYSCERYNKYRKKYKKKISKQLISLFHSIQKHGYAKGKFNSPRHMIRVKAGFVSPYGDDPEGYTLVARKNRAAVCVNTKKRIKCQLCRK